MQEIRKAQQLSFLGEDQGQVVREAERQAIRFILPHASRFLSIKARFQDPCKRTS